jgi:hypothetical protein
VESLYDLLGVDPDASPEELHRAYRHRARLLHPDGQAGRTAAEMASAQAAMSRLNEAWSVLRDPETRRRYDRRGSGYSGPGGWEDLGDGRAGGPGDYDRDGGYEGGDWPDGEWDESGPYPGFSAREVGLAHGRRRWLTAGPAVVLVGIMMVIFIFSAYAGPSTPPPTTPSTPTTNAAGLTLLGQCLDAQSGIDAVTDCTRPNGGRVVAVPGSGQGCPAGTTVHLLSDHSQVVCLDLRTASPGRP